MAVVKFTSNLKRFYPDLAPLEVSGKTVSEVLNEIENRYSGLKDYIVDENGTLRKHVNIFIGNEMVKDRERLMDELVEKDEVYVMQALSGG
ncbi:molybdenum cofactor biosynthesis protein MoaD [Roseivirga sp. 4D4]|uniref:MoaD/ThiS family protein n=1 Tax=Roseivirga sp. 4D4 TaxID=1889784 RepID=UPI0008535FC9|nr:MoaD/ThiS family protein [Roseivirga sp. 4D4]OEK00863.1 molybdenum cofactor biosynthesis protein MoaD [Roseivirga sp. 4D4]